MSLCSKCGESAVGACTGCGAFYCAAHGDKTAGDGFFTKAQHGLCEACHAQIAPLKTFIAVGIIGTILVGLVVFAILSSSMNK